MKVIVVAVERIWYKILGICPSVSAASDGSKVCGEMFRGRIWYRNLGSQPE
jgi:hypothetical protein